MNNINVYEAFERMIGFYSGKELTTKIADIENTLKMKNLDTVQKLLVDEDMNSDTLRAAFQIKKVAGQINVIIHTLGIMKHCRIFYSQMKIYNMSH